MEDMDLFAHAEKMGAILQHRLQQFAGHPLVGEVRGKGLIAAVELVRRAEPRETFAPSDGVGAYCSSACHEAGLVLRNLGDSIAICPPLIINETQIDELITKLGSALNQTHEWVKKQGLC
jgi:4-aminobutyrate--pyruvate transaminase